MDTQIYNTNVLATWCPGCGNFGVFTALKDALASQKLSPEQVVVVTDIGCSGNMADFINVYGFHSLHGRALPAAAGIKLANHKLKVVAVLGDGACYGEGLDHFISLMRGNHDIVAMVQDNFLYSLTTGQYSPTTPKGTITKTTPEGSIEMALNPIALALTNHTTFAARAYAFDIPHLTDLIAKALNHVGFSLIDTLEPCVTFNKNQTISWFKDRIYKLEKPFLNKLEAIKEAERDDKLGIGLFYQEQRLAYHQELAQLKERTMIEQKIERVDISELLKEFI